MKNKEIKRWFTSTQLMILISFVILMIVIMCSCTKIAYPDIEYKQMCSSSDYNYHKAHSPQWYHKRIVHYKYKPKSN